MYLAFFFKKEFTLFVEKSLYIYIYIYISLNLKNVWPDDFIA